MELSNHVHPTNEQIQTLLSQYPADTPIVMVNILRFRDHVKGEDESGVEAYERYGQRVLPFLKKVGVRLLWRGRVQATVIGSSEDPPHTVLLVQYPSVQKFLEMTSDPGYIEVSKDRSAALEYGGLLACDIEYSSFNPA